MNDFKNIEDLKKSLIKGEVSKLFVFAGAGSGKTYTLVQILKALKEEFGEKFAREGREIAVITFTNAAVDEINSRIFYDSLFAVSTLHSFIWECISKHQADIRKTYLEIIEDEILNITSQINSGSKARSLKRELERLQARKNEVESRYKFTYNPNGDNKSTQSLNHSEVILIGALLIKKNIKIQKVIISKYPYLLVDESQDTNKQLVDALFEMKRIYGNKFCLILVGDDKQRIYMDGKRILSKESSEGWDTLTLRVNYRSNSRIVRLGNTIASKIEKDADQIPKSDTEEGTMRLFLCPTIEDIGQQEKKERKAMEEMADITRDSNWKDYKAKILILEHRLAAVRLKFDVFFDAMYSIDSYKTGFLNGELSVMAVFKDLILPLYDSLNIEEREGENQNRLNIIRKRTNFNEGQDGLFKERRIHYVGVLKRIEECLRKDESIENVLKIINDENIYSLPSVLKDAISNEYSEEDVLPEVKVWNRVIQLNISTIIRYYDYVNDRTEYGTHQGVKGREFERVLCIVDDRNAKGHLFSFEKLLEVKDLSKQDIKNLEEKKDSVIDRTLRLFYVIATRARKSLAIIVYTEDVEKAKETAIRNGWFDENEIKIIDE